jgi:hypothetical protein
MSFDKLRRERAAERQRGITATSSAVVPLSPATLTIAEPPAPKPELPWPELHSKALHGLAGEIVNAIKPETESDPIAILIQLLVFFGNAIGRNPHFRIEDTEHHANLFVCLVGASSRARKGTSEGRVRAIMREVDKEWEENRIKSGLSSGEGFINEVRDELTRWNIKDKKFEVVEPAIADKRLLVVEPEFASVLDVKERRNNTLSSQIRRAYDGGTLATMTRAAPIKATNPHISIVAHITEAELRARLTRTDAANGFANRILFPCVRRSQNLPFGGKSVQEKISPLIERLKEAAANAKQIGRLSMDQEAQDLWREAYERLTADQPGLLGAVTARAEAQALRLAMIYALLDATGTIGKSHIQAAIAVWDYCEASAARIFGSLLGDDVADEILSALHQVGGKGLTRTEIRDLFGRNRSAERIAAALGPLLTKGRAKAEIRPTEGRPSEVWIAIAEGR